MTDLLMICFDLIQDLSAEEVQHGQNDHRHQEYQGIKRADSADHEIVFLLSGMIDLIQPVPYGHQPLRRRPQSDHDGNNGEGRGTVGIDILDHALDIFRQIRRKDL